MLPRRTTGVNTQRLSLQSTGVRVILGVCVKVGVMVAVNELVGVGVAVSV